MITFQPLLLATFLRLTVCSDIPTNSTLSNSCQGLSGVFPDVRDCRRYIHCWRNETYFFRCYEGFIFDPCNRRCLFQSDCISITSCGKPDKKVEKVGLLSLRPERRLSSLWERAHRSKMRKHRKPLPTELKIAFDSENTGQEFREDIDFSDATSPPTEFVEYFNEYGERINAVSKVRTTTEKFLDQSPKIEVEKVGESTTVADDQITYLIKVIFNRNPPQKTTSAVTSVRPTVAPKVQASLEAFTKHTERFLDSTAAFKSKSEGILKDELQTTTEATYFLDNETSTIAKTEKTDSIVSASDTKSTSTTSAAASTSTESVPSSTTSDTESIENSTATIETTESELENSTTDSVEEILNNTVTQDLDVLEINTTDLDNFDETETDPSAPLPHMCNITSAAQSAVCQCPDPQTVDLLTPTDLLDHCHNLRCRNGGMYLSLSSGHCGCVCPMGFQGDHCQDKSSPSQCHCANGGRCVGMVNGTFACQCPLGYLGGQCQHSVDHVKMVLENLVKIGQFERGQQPSMDLTKWTLCSVNFCINDGVCLKDVESGTRKCFCSDNFCGRNCERKCSDL